VLHWPQLRAKLPQITQLDVVRIIVLFEQAMVVEPREVPSVSRDPDDDKFLACAEMAGTEYLVTEDRDLLILETYEDCRICRPAEFIELPLARRALAE
jgi:putative PIN family toxin of toxin-antitoxin system